MASARRFMHDQDGMRAVGAAVAALAGDPYPPAPDGFRRGRYHRLRAGDYRIMYLVDEDTISPPDWDKPRSQTAPLCFNERRP